MFASLAYDDIKDAYEQSVVPDYGIHEVRPTSLEEIKSQRGRDNLDTLNNMQGEEVLRDRHVKEENENISQIYNLAKSDEISKRIMKNLSTRYLQLGEK